MREKSLFTAGLCLALLALLVVGARSSPAQSLYGLLRGEVRDGTGAAIAAAGVAIKNQETGGTRSQQTTSSGTFSFAQLAPGRYTLTVEASGFAGYSRPDVEVRTNQTADLIASLEVGQVKEVVNVEAGAAHSNPAPASPVSSGVTSDK